MSVAVITGGASGIGAGLAREAARRGMKVVLADRDEAGLKRVQAGIGAAAMAVACDVTDPAAMKTLAEKTFAAHGHVDLLFNNAGVLSTGLSWEIPAANWQRALDINIGGVVNGARAFVPRMLKTGQPARIVNTASIGGFFPSPMLAPYSATKFAVVGLTECLAGELASISSKIAVSLLAPGPVKTEIFRETPGAASRQFVDTMRTLLGENGLSPDAFAPLVFAAIDRGDYWIIPQPEHFDERFAARNAVITQRTPPDFFQVRR